MHRSFLPVSILVCFFACVVPSSVFSGQVFSTTRNVNAVTQAKGYFLAPAPEFSGQTLFNEHAPVQAFEIIRPKGEQIKIGRLYTSCTCVRLETSKATFARDERAVFYLHNIIPTPVNGQNYAIYVQVISPIRTTLRYDTFVQSVAYPSKPNASLVVGEAAEADAPETKIAETISETLREDIDWLVQDLEYVEEEIGATKEEPVKAPSPEIAEDIGERKTVELKVKEVNEPGEPAKPADSAEDGKIFDLVEDTAVDEYVAKFLEHQANEPEARTAKARDSLGEAVPELVADWMGESAK